MLVCAPDRPMVVNESRRCWALAAAWEMGPGNWVGGELLFVPSLEGRETEGRPVPNRSANVWPAREERR